MSIILKVFLSSQIYVLDRFELDWNRMRRTTAAPKHNHVAYNARAACGVEAKCMAFQARGVLWPCGSFFRSTLTVIPSIGWSSQFSRLDVHHGH